MRYSILFFLLFFAFCSCKENKQYDFVKDNAGILKKGEIELLDKRLNEFYELNGKQFLVYTIEKLNGFTVREYTNKLLDNIEFGAPGVNNSIVMFIYLREAKITFHWGKDFNKNMTEEYAKKIIEKVGKYFGKNDYKSGIEVAIEDLKRL